MGGVSIPRENSRLLRGPFSSAQSPILGPQVQPVRCSGSWRPSSCRSEANAEKAAHAETGHSQIDRMGVDGLCGHVRPLMYTSYLKGVADVLKCRFPNILVHLYQAEEAQEECSFNRKEG